MKRIRPVIWSSVILLTALLVVPGQTRAQEVIRGRQLYDALKRFELGGGSAQVKNLVLKRDRGEMTFDGTFYFETPVNGHVYGAVFVGRGSFHADAPPSNFEKDNLRRLLKADTLESDFETAVLRFSDDTFDLVGKGAGVAAPSPEVLKLATEFEPRLLKETGANVSARLAVSVLNEESPGFFLAEFDKGRRDRFTFLLDYQGRVPVATFDINGGEKGLIFAYRRYDNDIWMAFFSLEDYQRGRTPYADVFDLVDTPHYKMEVDVRQPKKALKLNARLDLVVGPTTLNAISFVVNDGLSEYDDVRLKKAMRLQSAKLASGAPIETAQENWESGLTVFLPTAVSRGEKLSIEMQLEGDFMYDVQSFTNGHYPRSNTSWYPRHGYLNRSTFDITFYHHKRYRLAAVGHRVREDVDPDDKNGLVTQYVMDQPVALVTFAMAPFERHVEELKMETGGTLPVEFSSLPGGYMPIKEDFIMAELGNCVRYFSALFGKYPYSNFGATFHPFGFGQGFPTMLMIPATDRASKYTYSFVAHEASHQWWGNIVAWRSYRDQWLSEGFAEYSGILYTGLRDTKGSQKDLIRDLRDSLTYPPATELGVGKGRLVDVGPVILGHRLSTRETYGAYQTLIYNKGALILRMLHFLFTDPQTGNGQPFFDMMSDFVKRYQNGRATTENFIAVANEHFARSPLGQRYKIANLNWFFDEYVYRTELPSYTFSYVLENQADGTVVLRGTLEQTGVPDSWFMALPLVMRFGKDRVARGVVAAVGPRSTITLKLPGKPDDVQLDPELWVMSDKTTTRK